jgi:hypothetical protein
MPTGPTGSGSDRVTLWYQVDSKEYYADKLENFTGDCIASLRETIKIKSGLTHPASTLKLVAACSDESEIDLDDMQDLEDEDGVFNFKQLVARYKIKQRNPIVVKLP